MRKDKKSNNENIPESEHELREIFNEVADTIEDRYGAPILGQGDFDDIFSHRLDKLPKADMLATVLAEAMQGTFGLDWQGNPVPGGYPAKSVEREENPPCAEKLFEYHGHPACIHISQQEDGSCDLSIAFFGKGRDEQSLWELAMMWPADPLSQYLSIEEEDCTDYALVLSGHLKPEWCEYGILLRLALKNIFGFFIDPETNQLLTAMIDCYSKI